MEYGVSKRTLRNKIKLFEEGKYILSDKRGKDNNIFTIEQEKAMYNNIKNNYIDKGIPFDNYLKMLAKKEWNKLHSDDKNFSVSNGWCSNFKKRWNLTSIRVTKIRKSNKNNEETEKNF